MRLFNAKIIDEFLEGAGDYAFSSESYACLLARAEALKITCIVDTLVGSPTVGGALFGSTSDVNYSVDIKDLFSLAVSTATTITAVYSPADPGCPPPRHLRVWVSITTGASTKAHVTVWACGRGPQLLETTSAVTPTFAAQYAAARMIDDEDRLIGRKRMLKPGASLFYPPELFGPATKWNR